MGRPTVGIVDGGPTGASWARHGPGGVDDRGDAPRVVAVLRSYADAGYPQREVERFTGLSPLELRRAVRGMEEVLSTV